MDSAEVVVRAIASPCTGMCRVGPEGELCLGCFRTVDEVCAWKHMLEEERAAIMAKLSLREYAWRTEQGLLEKKP